jgi:hypothetical protein
VVQRREDFRLALKACESLRIAGNRVWKDFEGDRFRFVSVAR